LSVFSWLIVSVTSGMSIQGESSISDSVRHIRVLIFSLLVESLDAYCLVLLLLSHCEMSARLEAREDLQCRGDKKNGLRRLDLARRVRVPVERHWQLVGKP